MSTTRRLYIPRSADGVLADGVRKIQLEMHLPTAFPAAVEAAAEKAALRPRLPDHDRSDISLVTIDPPGAMDLDQAMFVEQHGDGYRVYYAIADVAAFVSAGDAIDIEANRRGETLYGADAKIPLHPKVLSEGAASLLPDQTRPALLWTMQLDASGEGTAVDVRRALVRSRAKLDYASVQARIDADNAEPMWAVLRRIGELRKQREAKRGGVSLSLPEQEIHVVKGRWQLEFRAHHLIDDWNEQISLLTGMAGAHLMVEAGVGLLRTLPEPPAWAISRLRRTADALGIAWPDSTGYPAFIRSLDPTQPLHVAMMVASTSVLRGAGYTAFHGEVPEHPMHSALASTYAHVTAPLRRLVDRYGGEICIAICAGRDVPDWVLGALPSLPATMRESAQRASRYEHAMVDLAESVALAARVGETFEGVIVDVDHNDLQRGVAVIRDPAIEARVTGSHALPLGKRVKMTLTEADPATRSTRFTV